MFMLHLQLAAVMALLSMSSAAPINANSFISKVVETFDKFVNFIGEGKDYEAINADGVAAIKAWKGFPNQNKAPYTDNHTAAIEFATANWGVVPDGVNLPNCTINDGDRPVILIPGTGEQVYDNWAYMGPKLAKEGLCVYSFNHNPSRRWYQWKYQDDQCFYGDIPSSASALSTFVDQILNLTGASEVDFVGHSQGGGALPFYYLKNLGGADKVRKMIGIAPSLGTDGNDGIQKIGASTNSWLPLSDAVLNAFTWHCNYQGTIQQLYNSKFMINLHKGGPGVPGVQYVNIATKADDVLLPYTRCRFEKKDGIDVTNLVLQDFCENDYSNHGHVSYSANVYTLVKNYLFDIEFANITCQTPPLGAEKRPDVYPVSTAVPDLSLYEA